MNLGPHSRISLSGLGIAFALLIAGAIVALTLTPSSVWRHPTNDATYRGFDPNLMFVSLKGPAPNSGDVTVGPNTLTITAKPDSHPTVHLLTTPLTYSASFDAQVTSESPASTPLRIEVWSPATLAGYVLLFDANGDVIREQTVAHAKPSQDLVGGTAGNERVLGSYAVGTQYHVTLNVDQSGHSLRVQILGASSPEVSSVVTAAEAPDLFAAFRPTLTLSSSAMDGTSQAVIRNFLVMLPSQPSNTAEATVKVVDPLARTLSMSLWVAALAISVLVGAGWLVATRKWWSSASPLAFRKGALFAIVIGLGGVLYLVANMPLFGLATPHSDVFGAKVWSYVALNKGVTELYYRTLLVPAAVPWLGVPLHEAGFPYGMTKAYYYFGVGWINHLLLNQSAKDVVNAFSFEQLLKGLNVLFGFADSLLVYLILKPLVARLNAMWSAIVFGLNPAVIFVMSVWGATETVSIFFVLCSILLAEKHKPLGAWVMLAAAAYTRPQMLVFAFLLGLVYLRKFEPRANLSAIPLAVIVCFVFIGPFAIGISPSLPIDYVARTFSYHIGNQQADPAYLAISPGYYSVWTVPLLLVNGEHGLQRMWWPPSQTLVGSWNYGEIGAIASVAVVLGAGALLLFASKASMQRGRYLPLVAFGMLGWLLVTPNLISRYIVYAILAVVLCRGAFTLGGYLAAVGVLTATTLVGTFGQLALDFLGYSGGLNILSPANNSFSNSLFELFSADPFITLASVSSFAVLIVLATRGWQSLRADRVPDLALVSTGA